MNKIAQRIQYLMPAVDNSLKQKIILGVLGLGAAGGLIYFGRKWYLKSIANREETKSFEDGTPATLAKQLKMAFENDGWPGTNTDAIRNVLRQIPTKEVFKQVALSYHKLYNGSLMQELSSELQSSEYSEMMSIIAGKPSKAKGKPGSKEMAPTLPLESWAKRLKAAFDKKYGLFPGTDEEAIRAVLLEIPTQAVFAKTAAVYERLHGNKLLDDLKSESEWGEYGEYMATLSKKPKR